MAENREEIVAAMLPDPPVCLITADNASPSAVASTVDGALAGGLRWVQLRRRHDTGRCFFELAFRLRDITAAYSATLIINDRVDIALACGADGVHLPATGMEPATVRGLFGSTALLGRSVHHAAEVVDSINEQADYFQFGPIFDTPSKRAFGKPQGLAVLAETVRRAGERNLVAVGGIGLKEIASVAGSGSAGVAMIGVFAAAKDPQRVARELIMAFCDARQART